ncbi:MAG: hypothetical protein WC552_01545 [Candidatus Omnitrophota bacterium]
MFKKIFFVSLFFFLVAHPGLAFLYNIEVLKKDAIVKLSDEGLLDRYIDVLVEVEASTTFHQTSGFKPSDYEKYKQILRYRLLLLQEIEKRNLDVPGRSNRQPMNPNPEG